MVNRITGLMPSVDLARLLPEPKNRIGETFRKVMEGAGSAVLRGASSLTSINPEFMNLINQQIAVQMQMQLVSLHSNLLKSKHETEMAAIRNVRVG